MADTSIKYIENAGIDRQKWDRCIEHAGNGLIYGYSFYLDHMASHWDGLVLGDYEAVMPLTWKSKFSVHYLYQPFLSAQLGIFGNDIDEALCLQFISEIPSRFKFIDIYLNYGNFFGGLVDGFYGRQNFVLNLEAPYETLRDAYKETTVRNIKKASQSALVIDPHTAATDVIELASRQVTVSYNETKDNMDRFLSLFGLLESRGMAKVYGVRSQEGYLFASAIFLISNNRAYYLLVGNHQSGKQNGSSHALIDAFIKDHAGQRMLLDFEGSDIPTLAFFYSSFGAVDQPYPGLKLNRLPGVIRWMKK